MNKMANINMMGNNFSWGELLEQAQKYKYGWILLLTPAFCNIGCHLIDAGFQKFGEIVDDGHPVEVDLKNGVIRVQPIPAN